MSIETGPENLDNSYEELSEQQLLTMQVYERLGVNHNRQFTINGKVLPFINILEHCGPSAEDAFRGFMSMDTDDEKYSDCADAINSTIDYYADKYEVKEDNQ